MFKPIDIIGLVRSIIVQSKATWRCIGQASGSHGALVKATYCHLAKVLGTLIMSATNNLLGPFRVTLLQTRLPDFTPPNHVAIAIRFSASPRRKVARPPDFRFLTSILSVPSFRAAPYSILCAKLLFCLVSDTVAVCCSWVDDMAGQVVPASVAGMSR
jgi:hypothetical protein